MTDLERTQSILKELGHGFISYGNLHDDEEHGCKVIEKALKKTISMRPVIERGRMRIYDWAGNVDIEVKEYEVCPICEECILTKEQMFCMMCGQALERRNKK